MVRSLRFHERKLLKKVDFIDWKTNNVKELAFINKYHINRQEFTLYNNLCHKIWKLCQKISSLGVEDVFRNHCSHELISKLFSMALIKTKRLKKCNSVNVKSFCRRRLAVYVVQSGMFSGPLSTAVKYVKHGHIRVGPNVVTDPAFLVSKTHEDFISWTENFKTKIDNYNELRDDYKQ